MAEDKLDDLNNRLETRKYKLQKEGKCKISNIKHVGRDWVLTKNERETQTGKKMFIRLYEAAKKSKDKKLQEFCNDVLSIYEQHGINCQIVWKK